MRGRTPGDLRWQGRMARAPGLGPILGRKARAAKCRHNPCIVKWRAPAAQVPGWWLPTRRGQGSQNPDQDPMHQKAVAAGDTDARPGAAHAPRAQIANPDQDPMHHKAVAAGDTDARLGAAQAPRARIAKSQTGPHAPERRGRRRRGGHAGAYPRAEDTGNWPIPNTTPYTRKPLVVATRMPSWGLPDAPRPRYRESQQDPMTTKP